MIEKNLVAQRSKTTSNSTKAETKDPEVKAADLATSNLGKQQILDDRLILEEKTLQSVVPLEVLALTCNHRKEMFKDKARMHLLAHLILGSSLVDQRKAHPVRRQGKPVVPQQRQLRQRQQRQLV